MKLFWTLLLKDLRRIVRNPIPILILLGIPMAITTLIGFAFGGSGNNDHSQVAPIRLGLIDQDDSLFSQFLRGAVGQDDFAERIQVTFIEDETSAVQMIQDGKLSAVLIIPEGFTSAFVSGDNGLKLQLIKNPSEYLYPTLAQEGSEVIVTALNALIRNFQKDLQELHGLLESEREFDFFRDVLAVSTLIERSRSHLAAAEVYLNPPLVTYEKEGETSADTDASAAEETIDPTANEKTSERDFNIFAYLLVGMAAMFMLMIADNCMRDLYKETRNRTLERFRTMREGLWVFIAVKVFYSILVLLLTIVILLGCGSLIFKFGWQEYGPTLALVLAYSLFGAGFMGLVAAVAGKERRADMLNTMIVIVLSAVGGAMWPADSLPPFIREFITPYSPVYWFASQLRQLQIDPLQSTWMQSCAGLAGLGIVAILGSSMIFRWRLERGIKE